MIRVDYREDKYHALFALSSDPPTRPLHIFLANTCPLNPMYAPKRLGSLLLFISIALHLANGYAIPNHDQIDVENKPHAKESTPHALVKPEYKKIDQHPHVPVDLHLGQPGKPEEPAGPALPKPMGPDGLTPPRTFESVPIESLPPASHHPDVHGQAPHILLTPHAHVPTYEYPKSSDPNPKPVYHDSDLPKDVKPAPIYPIDHPVDKPLVDPIPPKLEEKPVPQPGYHADKPTPLVPIIPTPKPVEEPTYPVTHKPEPMTPYLQPKPDPQPVDHLGDKPLVDPVPQPDHKPSLEPGYHPQEPHLPVAPILPQPKPIQDPKYSVAPEPEPKTPYLDPKPFLDPVPHIAKPLIDPVPPKPEPNYPVDKPISVPVTPTVPDHEPNHEPNYPATPNPKPRSSVHEPKTSYGVPKYEPEPDYPVHKPTDPTPYDPIYRPLPDPIPPTFPPVQPFPDPDYPSDRDIPVIHDQFRSSHHRETRPSPKRYIETPSPYVPSTSNADQHQHHHHHHEHDKPKPQEPHPKHMDPKEPHPKQIDPKEPHPKHIDSKEPHPKQIDPRDPHPKPIDPKEPHPKKEHREHGKHEDLEKSHPNKEHSKHPKHDEFMEPYPKKEEHKHHQKEEAPSKHHAPINTAPPHRDSTFQGSSPSLTGKPHQSRSAGVGH